MATYETTTWTTTATTGTGWYYPIANGDFGTAGGNFEVAIGIGENAPIAPFGQGPMDYRIGRDKYSYAEADDSIKVDKGSPTKARYAVFYAVNKDPVIFCKTRREMIKEVKKLLKRKEVDQRSIRIFALMGGAKIVRQFKAEKKYPVQCK
jgi:hypothetical protein